MNLFARLFQSKYDDEQLVAHAQTALATDPLLTDVTGVTVVSTKGVIRLTGTVRKLTEKDRVEGAIRNTLRTAGLKHDHIINEIQVR